MTKVAQGGMVRAMSRSDPQTDILVYLLGVVPGKNTTAAICRATGHSPTTVRNHLRVMAGSRRWVSGSRVGNEPYRWHLTIEGSRVAGWRA